MKEESPYALNSSCATQPQDDIEGPASEDAGQSINIEKLNQSLDINFSLETVSEPSNDSHKTAGLFEEIAEDMLDLLQQIRLLEKGQSELFGRLDRIERALHDATRLHACEIDTLRRDLLGDNKSMNALSVFNTVVLTLDALRAMHAKLHSSKDARTRTQLNAVIQSLSTTLRGLGFAEFQATKGEPFDPARMECLGFLKGKPGIVLNIIRPGYVAHERVVRPVGVMLADPKHEATNKN